LKEILTKVVDVAVDKFAAEYVEARAQTLSRTTVTVKEGRVEAARQGIENGVALRVLVNGAWGFASVGAFDANTLTGDVLDACSLAKAASS